MKKTPVVNDNVTPEFFIVLDFLGMLREILPRLVGVVHDLGGEGLEGGELPLLPQVLVKLHLDLLAVEIAVEIQDEALHFRGYHGYCCFNILRK